MKKFDNIIIGFGKGGKTLAGKLAEAGHTVALIEKSENMYGGTCINVGCIPSKSLVHSAEQSRKRGDLSFAEKSLRYTKAVEEKRRLTSTLRKKNFDKLNQKDSITIFNGIASFRSEKQIEVTTQEEAFLLEAPHIFINTGSVPVIPPIDGIAGNPYVYTSETLMELTQLPRRLIIVGGGYIGLEFASMYSGFGSEVTVLQDGTVFLPREDPDIAEEIQRALEAQGVAFHFGVSITSISQEPDEARVCYTRDNQPQSLPADAVLIATGRKPNTGELHLSNAGIEVTGRGAVKVDENLQTNVPGIWAMGDVAGGLQFTYVSLDDYRNVWSQLNPDFVYPSKRREQVPYSVFITPAFSRVGLNETQARQAGYDVKIARLPAAAIPKAQVLKQPMGVLKAVIDAKSNRILGAMLLCEASFEMINIIKLAMDLDAPYTTLRDQIFTHPTMSEALNDLFTV